MTTDTGSGTTNSADGTAIAWDRMGSGRAVVLVDPILFSRATSPLAALAQLLSKSFTVYRYDRRGKGQSGDASTYTPDREFEDLEAVLAVAGGNAGVYGFSSGAVLAMRTAAAGASIARLVVLEPPMVTEDNRGPDIRDELQELVNGGHRGAAIRRYHESIGVPPEIVDNMSTVPLEPAAYTMVYDLTLLRETSLADWRAVRIPTLVLASTGSDPRLLGWAESAAAALPAGTLTVLAGPWHGIADDVLATATAQFLSD
jgi:pimeloyl-ACP methyl ester carboxylesterase